jgi:hypothetical protein
MAIISTGLSTQPVIGRERFVLVAMRWVVTTMTAAHISAPLRSVPASCAGIIDCGGARISAHVRGPATVLVVHGDIDVCNSGLVGAAIRRLSPPSAPIVLDLRATDFIGLSGFRELLTFADECDRTKVALHVVPGVALRPLLRVFADHGLPVVDANCPAGDSASIA